jgi:hypothetical protein
VAPEAPAPAPPRGKAKARQSPPDAVPFTVVKPAERDDRWTGARCNDGTPFALEVRDQGSDTWVVQVMGGFFCEDVAVPCAERRPNLTTTLPRPDGSSGQVRSHGLHALSKEENPDFHAANHVRLHYCSSDLWLGASTARQPTTGSADGWFFSGRVNFQAGLEWLASNGLEPADRVLLVGYSAGGAGVVGNLDRVSEVLPEASAAGRVKVVLDGSWIPTWAYDKMPDADRWGEVHPACAADHRSKGLDPGACIFGPAWWPAVSTGPFPILVALSGADATQLPAFGVDAPEDLARWRANARKSLEPLPWVFSGGSRYHVLAMDEKFASFGPPGDPLSRLVGEFWRGEAPRQVFFGYEP